jgi:hypothetical protein
MKHECHVFKLAQPDVEIFGCAAHPIGHQEFGLIDEWYRNSSPHQAASEEPARGPDECPQTIMLVQWVSQYSREIRKPIQVTDLL